MADKLKSIIADVLRISSEEIADDLTMKQTSAWDSLKHMELVVALEQEFGTEFTFEEIATMQSVVDIKIVIESRNLLK